jgi:uncharacterized membrane protein YgaE (UPF0421/DUF939 family)
VAAVGENVAAALDRMERQGGRAGKDSVRRLRTFAVIAVQAGLAAAISWVISNEVLHNPDPVFAPAAAVATIVSSIGRRLRRTVELVGGVLIGIAIGDLLIELVGTGPWQIGVVVAVAILLAILLDGSSTLMTQAGATAVLIVALSPTAANLEVPRFINAVTGTLVGIGVYLVLFPLHPLRLIQRRASPVVDQFATELAGAADALSAGDLGGVESALERLRNADPGLRNMREAVRGAMEVATLAPARRHGRSTLVAYNDGVDHLERALRNSRGTLRRIADLIRANESVPQSLPPAIRQLAEGVRTLHHDLLAGRPSRPARAAALNAAAQADQARTDDPGPNGGVVAAQIRTIAFDLLRASGAGRSQARELIRAAAPE